MKDCTVDNPRYIVPTRIYVDSIIDPRMLSNMLIALRPANSVILVTSRFEIDMPFGHDNANDKIQNKTYLSIF
jgi:hypothetical protein